MDQRVKNILFGLGALFVLLVVIGALSGNDAANTPVSGLNVPEKLTDYEKTVFFTGVAEGLAVGKELGRYDALDYIARTADVDSPELRKTMSNLRTDVNELIDTHNDLMRDISAGSGLERDVILQHV